MVGQAVRLSFDALPGRSVDGHISAIAGAPEPRAEWGSGSYFVVDIELPPKTRLPLLPGMSVRVVAPSPAVADEPRAAPCIRCWPACCPPWRRRPAPKRCASTPVTTPATIPRSVRRHHFRRVL